MIPKYAVEALGKSVVRDEGNRIQLSAALRKGAGRTNTSHVRSARLKAIPLLMVIDDTQINVGPARISHTTPKYLKDLVGGKVGVVNGAERIAARELPGANGLFGFVNAHVGAAMAPYIHFS
ncbi:MAG TPA: hypothetical protein VNV14_07020 [Opitutaceae bacterium]|jgi:hypothetical protein|nr:hypothetical protein [Opitutaceae bacterium]